MPEVRTSVPLLREAYSPVFGSGESWQIRAWVYDVTHIDFSSDSEEGSERIEIERYAYEGSTFGGQADLVKYTDGTQPILDTPFVAENVITGFGSDPTTLQLWQFTDNPRVDGGGWVKDYGWVSLGWVMGFIASASYIAANGELITFSGPTPTTDDPVYLILTVEIADWSGGYAAAKAEVDSIQPVVTHVYYTVEEPPPEPVANVQGFPVAAGIVRRG